MRKPKSYSIQEVFNAATLGLAFEFYSSKDTQFIAEDLGKLVNSNVAVTSNEKSTPTYTTSILLKEYNGERPRYRFLTCERPYIEASNSAMNVVSWIKENAVLDNSTTMRVSVSFDRGIECLSSISSMNSGKLILKVDEAYLHSLFPKMKSSPYAISVKRLLPYNMASNGNSIANMKNDFKVPVGSFYGVDLTSQPMGSVSFNYIGGDDYCDNPGSVKKAIEYYVITTYQTINSDDDSKSLVDELNRLTEEYRKFRRCYYDYEMFNETYKDFKSSIDLNDNPDYIATKWFQMRDTIGKLILESGIKKCKFNWDTDLGLFQVKDTAVENAYISDVQLLDSSVCGVIERCQMWGSNIKGSRLLDCILVEDNEVRESHIIRTRADRTNTIDESYINNTGEIINCDVKSSIVKNAGVGESARLDENCLVISYKENVKFNQGGIEINGVRDYNWIKSLRRENYKDAGFQNEYKHKL